jgi:hypothetical protein
VYVDAIVNPVTVTVAVSAAEAATTIEVSVPPVVAITVKLSIAAPLFEALVRATVMEPVPDAPLVETELIEGAEGTSAVITRDAVTVSAFP